jgi:type IV secretory pathway TrbF-like protein
MELIGAAQSYRTKELTESVYLRARDEWDNRIGQSVVQAKNWRVACILSLILSVLLFFGFLYQASRNKVIPMIIAVDRQSGEPKIIGKVTEITYQPQEQEIKYFLNHFIQRVRAVPNDSVLIKQNWLEAYHFMRPAAAAILNEQTQSDINSPLKKIGEKQVVVQVISVTKISDISYQLRWTETLYAKSGEKLDRYNMSGIFSIEFDTPTTEKALTINPLGLFITSFQWTKEMTGDET